MYCCFLRKSALGHSATSIKDFIIRFHSRHTEIPNMSGRRPAFRLVFFICCLFPYQLIKVGCISLQSDACLSYGSTCAKETARCLPESRCLQY